MRLNINRIINGHVSLDTVNEIEKTILEDKIVTPLRKKNKKIFNYLYLIIRILRKLRIPVVFKTNNKYLKNPLSDNVHFFTMMMGLDEAKYKPYAYFTNHCRSIYIIDAWPKDHDKIIEFIHKNKIDYLFVSSIQASERLAKRTSKTKTYWIPEGVNYEEYRFYKPAEKDIEVLAFGRKFDLYHELIKDKLEEKNIKYLYEKEKGKIIFPSRNDFIDGLARTKISICVTSDITHPERSGDIETMNIRYLQSIVSKCLIVGHAPKEMIDLFGYNPVIEIEMHNPVGQLLTILDNFNNYQLLIEKNYQEVISHHTWKHRWEQIKQIYEAN